MFPARRLVEKLESEVRKYERAIVLYMDLRVFLLLCFVELLSLFSQCLLARYDVDQHWSIFRRVLFT